MAGKLVLLLAGGLSSSPQGLCAGFSCVPMTWWLTIPRVGEPRGQGRIANAFYDLSLEVTPSPL